MKGVTHIVSKEKDYWKRGELFKSGGREAADTLEMTEDYRQEILGFGGCFNELGWKALQRVGKVSRDAFIRELFGEEGCRFNLGRLPIGANDFSLEWYSCDETEEDYELTDFSIERDKRYTIPYIKEAMKYCPDLTLFASPWSPPTWMKTKKAYNNGRIRMEEKVLDAYARYFVRFVEEYGKEGVPIRMVHVQNEPMADQKFPSCLWYGSDMRDFIKGYLGPAFEKSGLPTQLWLGTINGPFVDFRGEGMGAPYHEFYDQFANTILSDPDARKYLTGVGVQWGGKHQLEQIELSYPEMKIMQTESECGDGKNEWEQAEYIFTQLWYYFHHGAQHYTYWNMALFRGGESTWGWTQNSLAVVNERTGRLSLQPEFYLMKHFSHFIRPGARLVRAKGHFAANALIFENPDGEIVITALNSMDHAREITFKCKDTQFTATLDAHTIHTFVVG